MKKDKELMEAYGESRNWTPVKLDEKKYTYDEINAVYGTMYQGIDAFMDMIVKIDKKEYNAFMKARAAFAGALDKITDNIMDED